MRRARPVSQEIPSDNFVPAGRLEVAAAEGRLGVSESVCGRVRHLGGTATLTTAPGQGTEWELTFPR